MQSGSMELSVVVPFYNEVDTVDELYRRLKNVLEELGRGYEMVFVDDGSLDGTGEKLAALSDADSTVSLIRLRRNFGQTAGLAAGFDFALGEVILAMDGDLQHFPEDIPLLIAQIDAGYDIASGWRKDRVDSFFIRRIPSWIANRMMAKLSGVKLNDFGTTFKAYRKAVIKNIELYPGFHRFIPALASWQGVSIAEVPIQNIERPKGVSKYGLSRSVQVFFDLITIKFVLSYMSKPLQFFGSIGAVFFGVGFLAALAIAFFYYLGDLVINEHLGNLIFAMLMMVLGVQLGAIGLSLEVGTRTYYRASRQKIYAVREIRSSRGKR
ncbi:MAG: glycosyltransferase family 2 protein [bacterium]|nr:glycosyltransferase family 2 protein [bacterium]